MRTRLLPLIGAALLCQMALPLRPDFIVPEPFPFYTSQTTLIDISGIPDSTFVSKIQDANLQVSFTTSMLRLTVPDTWATWNSPPSTETDKPLVLFSNGAASLTLALSSPVSAFGFELQPDLSEVEPVLVTFSGPGTTISLSPDGNAGALLFALSSNTPITQVSITDEAGEDFAIANVRYAMIPVFAPEPATLPTLGIALAALSAGIRRRDRCLRGAGL